MDKAVYLGYVWQMQKKLQMHAKITFSKYHAVDNLEKEQSNATLAVPMTRHNLHPHIYKSH